MSFFDRIAWFYSATHTRKVFKKKDYETALKMANVAYDKSIKAFGPEHIRTAQTCYNLVVINSKLREFEEAEKYGLEALKIMEDLRGKNDFTLIDDLRNLQSVYKEWGQNDKVDELEERINKISEVEDPEFEDNVEEDQEGINKSIEIDDTEFEDNAAEE